MCFLVLMAMQLAEAVPAFHPPHPDKAKVSFWLSKGGSEKSYLMHITPYQFGIIVYF